MLSHAVVPTGRHPFLRGFTLMELMLTLAIISIVAAFGLPMGLAMLQDSRLTTETNSLVRDLNFARHKAIVHKQRVSLCASRDGVSCGGQWADGWVVFIDMDGIPGKVNINDTVLLRRPVTANNITLDAGASYVSFNPTGVTSYAMLQANDVALLPDARAALFSHLGHSLLPGHAALGDMLIPPANANTPASNHSGSRNTNRHISCTASSLASSAARCDGARLSNLASVGAVSTLSDANFLFCDSARTGERGNLLSVSTTGRLQHQKVTCN